MYEEPNYLERLLKEEPEIIPLDENVSKENINKIRKAGYNTYSLSFIDSRSDFDKVNDLFIDISDLEGLPDNRFEEKFFKYCDMIKDRSTKVIYIPVYAWVDDSTSMNIRYTYKNPQNKNALCALLRLLLDRTSKAKKNLEGFTFIFADNNSNWFAVNVDELKPADKAIILSNIELFTDNSIKNSKAFTGTTSTTTKKKANDNKTVEKKQEERKEAKNEKKKEELVKQVQTIAATSNTEDEAEEKMNNDAYIAQLLEDLEDDEYGAPKFSNARTERLSKAQKEFLDSSVGNRSVGEILNSKTADELPETALPVHSINDEWQHQKFINFGKEYDFDADIVRILNSFSDKDYPIVVNDITVEDTSTVMDYVNTYHVQMEDSKGKRFTITFDVPKFRNNRFMKIRGNEKVIAGQLLNLPCTKTDNDTVQVVSNYSKIFVRRYGSVGKSYPTTDRLIKSLRKYTGNKIKVIFGDNSRVCTKYNLPIDYVDAASIINTIETPTKIFYFNQDEYSKFGVDYKKGVPIAVMKENNSVLYWADEDNKVNILPTQLIIQDLYSIDEEFREIYDKQKPATKHVYSQASIMASRIPLIVVLGITMRFTDILKHAKIKYSIEDKRFKYDPDRYGCIRFEDSYLLYELTLESSMLMNGLYDVDTEMYKFVDMEKKRTWLDFLDKFGGRIIADGLENFSLVFLDPITKEICEKIRIPNEYHDLLIYANNLLVDTKYNKHTDITSNRYRTNEIVAGHVYKILAFEYSNYRAKIKRGMSATMSVKRSAIIDDILTKNPVTSDLSAMTPLLELEASNSATFKGLSGLNTERAYSLDKRTFDDSMINKLSLSTGFAGNVGVNRQTTIDMDVHGTRGYINNSNKDDMSISKTFSATEAITPFGATSDDPFRTAMTHIQTSKHSMPVEQSAPLLITNGADEAMAYIVSDTYVFKAKDDGVVTEIAPDDYCIITYRNGKNDIINLKETTKKNSDGGFYITIQLTCDLKEKQKFKKNDILAYDKNTFSNKVGEADSIAYNVGTLAKAAIMSTDEGFEDSTIISNWLSEAMGGKIDTEIPITLDKSANIYDIVKIGQHVEEGDPLIVFQNAFEDKDANILLKHITDEDFVSDLGRIRVKAKYTGTVQNIKIYRTCEIDDDMSDSMKKIINNYEKDIKKKKALYKKYDLEGANELEPDYKMPQTGILKNVEDGVKIIFYISYVDKLGIADKLVWQSANKGVVKDIFPIGLEPYTAHRPDQKVHAFGSSRSFNARMVTSPIISGALNKMLINLDEQVKQIMGIAVPRVEDIQ